TRRPGGWTPRHLARSTQRRRSRTSRELRTRRLCGRRRRGALHSAGLRRDQQGHCLALHDRVALDDDQTLERLQNLVDDLAALLGVRDLTAAEADGDLRLVTLFEEAPDVFDLRLEVVVVRLRAHLDLFDLDDVLLLLGLVGLLLFFVLEASEVHDLAHGR